MYRDIVRNNVCCRWMGLKCSLLSRPSIVFQRFTREMLKDMGRPGYEAC